MNKTVLIIVAVTLAVSAQPRPIFTDAQSKDIMMHGHVRPEFSISGLSKTSAVHSTVTHVIWDSVATYDYLQSKYLPMENSHISYSANGKVKSYEEKFFNGIIGIDTGMIEASGVFDSIGNDILINSKLISKDSVLIMGKTIWHLKNGEYPFSYDNSNGTGFAILSYYKPFFSVLDFTFQSFNIKDSIWEYFQTDTIKSIGSGFVIALYRWDINQKKYQLNSLDTIFQSGQNIDKIVFDNYSNNDTFQIISLAKYDSKGNEINETQDTMKWNGISKTWTSIGKTKITQTYDSHNNILTALREDSTDHWRPLDSCDRFIYTYVYDNSGFVTSRIDSSWSATSGGKKEMHFFKYQTFQLPIISQKPSKEGASRQDFSISSRGIIRSNAPISLKGSSKNSTKCLTNGIS